MTSLPTSDTHVPDSDTDSPDVGIPSAPDHASTPALSHPRITQGKAEIFKPRYWVDLMHVAPRGLLSVVLISLEPVTYVDAMRDPKWHETMRSEMHALHHNQTWTLVLRSSCSNVIGCCWLFCTKYRSDGSIERYKARLEAQGFSQVPSLDYPHTFNPVVKAATVRVVLTLSINNGWSLLQLDVNKAFLHDTLRDTVFMHPPPDFVDTRFPDHLCKLNKAIYGLKQAPWAWFHRLSSFLVANGFSYSRTNPFPFIFRRD